MDSDDDFNSVASSDDIGGDEDSSVDFGAGEWSSLSLVRSYCLSCIFDLATSRYAWQFDVLDLVD